jgi:hypothetical protein
MGLEKYFSDIDTGIPLSQCMPIAELSDDGDGVEARVLGEGGWDHLERVGVRLETVRFHTLE